MKVILAAILAVFLFGCTEVGLDNLLNPSNSSNASSSSQCNKDCPDNVKKNGCCPDER